MAADTFKTFFQNIFRDLKADEEELREQSEREHHFDSDYVFLIRHFCGPTTDDIEKNMRTIYMQEGAKAESLRNAMKSALEQEHIKFLLFRYQNANPVNQDFIKETFDNLINAILIAQPNFGRSDSVKKHIQRYIDEKLDFEENDLSFCFKNFDLSISNVAYTRYKRTHKIEDLKEICKKIAEKHPNVVIADNEVKTLNRLHEFLHYIISWDKKNPDTFNPDKPKPRYPKLKEIVPYFISSTTSYYRTSEVRAMLKRKPGHSPSSTPRNSSSPHALKPIPMPNFGNVIGAKIIWPPYILDALGTVFFQYPAKQWCRGINSIADFFFDKDPVEKKWLKRGCGGFIKSCIKSGVKFIFKIPVLPLMLVKATTFVTARILSWSGLVSIGNSIKNCFCGTQNEVVPFVSSEELQSRSHSRRVSRSIELSKLDSPTSLQISSPTTKDSAPVSPTKHSSQLSPTEVKRASHSRRRYQDFKKYINPVPNSLDVPGIKSKEDAIQPPAYNNHMFQPIHIRPSKPKSPENDKQKRLTEKAMMFSQTHTRVSSDKETPPDLKIVVEENLSEHLHELKHSRSV